MAKTKLDLILDKVEAGKREVTFDVRGYSKDQVDRIIQTAKDRGLDASSDGRHVLVRKLNPGRKHLTGGVSQKAQRAYEHIYASLPKGRRRKEVAARTVRGMISRGILNPSKQSKSDAQEYYKGHAIFKGTSGGYYVPTLPLSNYPTLEGARKAIDKRMSDRKGNPGLADEISEGFHGRKVSERFEVEEEELYPDNLAVLGCLVELSIISGSGVIPIRGFKNPYSPGYRKGDEVYLAAADRNNLEFVGGDQEIVNADRIAQHTNKTLVKLGKVKSIVYLADKHHLVGSNGKEEEYEHDFGKKKYFLFGKQVGQPELLYDCLNKTMKLVGGTYTITDEGIRD